MFIYYKMLIQYIFVSQQYKAKFMNKKDYQQFLQHCQVVSKSNDDLLVLRVNSTKQQILLRYLRNVSNEVIPILSQQKQINHEHVQSIIDYCKISSDTIAVFTEHWSHSLYDETEARKKTLTEFTLQQLENILLSVLKALNYLQTKSIGHGCVSLKDIVISSDGTVKLIDPSLASSSPLTLIYGYYYSPELLCFNSIQNQGKSLNFSQTDLDDIDFFKNDIFVLGLLVLELGLLSNSLIEVFDYGNSNIDFNLLQKYFSQFEKKYPNQSFVFLLYQMLQLESVKRISTQNALDLIEQMFDSEEDENSEDYSFEGSNFSGFVGPKQKTVKSFKLSQGRQFTENSLQSSQESFLMESSIKGDNSKRLSMGRPLKTLGKTPLIKC